MTTSNTNGNICVSADNLCGQSVKTCLGIIITSIVEDVNANVLSVYPNPNLGSFTIKFPYLISTPFTNKSNECIWSSYLFRANKQFN